MYERKYIVRGRQAYLSYVMFTFPFYYYDYRNKNLNLVVVGLPVDMESWADLCFG